MRMCFRPFVVIFLVWCASAVGAAGADASKGCTVSIKNDVDVAPAAELATTKGRPDIVTLENSVIRVSSIPNRGRLIFDYVYKPTGRSYLYNKTSPMPTTTDKGYFMEFGGCYVSHPWNAGANQPHDLEYEVTRKSPEECAIRIHKKDPETAIGLEAVISVKKKDPAVYVEIKLVNAGKKDRTIDFFDRAVVSTGEKMNRETRVVLPEGVDAVTVGRNADGWMGSEGKALPWPQPWRQWGEFKNEGRFHADLTRAKKRVLAVHDPKAKESFVKEWSEETPFRKVEISSFGPAWEDTFGAYPGFTVTTTAEKLVIPAGGSKRFEIKLYVSRD